MQERLEYGLKDTEGNLFSFENARILWMSLPRFLPLTNKRHHMM